MARVLVIDDEPDVLLLCRLNLEHAGHEVYGALNAEVGLTIAREVRPDVVVSPQESSLMNEPDLVATSTGYCNPP
jgi:DNA-binding NtrC family response regulator